MVSDPISESQHGHPEESISIPLATKLILVGNLPFAIPHMVIFALIGLFLFHCYQRTDLTRVKRPPKARDLAFQADCFFFNFKNNGSQLQLFDIFKPVGKPSGNLE